MKMSTTCTAANSLARNNSGCSASMYASMALHSDETDDGMEESNGCSSSALSENNIRMSRVHRSMLSPMRSVAASVTHTRRNKRKNFQPRNIRQSSSATEGESQDVTICDNTQEDSASNGAFDLDGRHVIKPRAESFASNASSDEVFVPSAKSQMLEKTSLASHTNSSLTSREVPLDLSDVIHHPKHNNEARASCDFISNEEESNSTDEILEAISNSSHSSDSSGIAAGAVDLSLRPASDSDDDLQDESESSDLKMNTWMLLWQQQKNSDHCNLSQAHHDKALSRADVSAMTEYAETTMRELLSLYGLPREAAELTLASGRLSEMGGSDPSLIALQTHMQSVLRAAASRTGPGPSQSPTHHEASPTLNLNSPSATIKQGAMLPPNMAPFVALNFTDSKSAVHVVNNDSLPSQPSSVGVPVITSAANRKPILAGGSRSGSGSTSKGTPIDYTRYVKRFSSALECGSPYCKDLNYREHFHCLDCNARVFVKKEEMIRHFKWHKKRDESLQHGFMRYSPMDDCGDRFRGCSHNRKQTHYHCLKEGCDKVYISTSDVQMHANYHRKDSAIIQEGFQRYRATEDCATSYCAFAGQRTTHFHCRRSGCTYTFKNKADMEKHKSYHIKDEQLSRDGFKKFMKNEHCNFDSCRFSKVCNHIHCIRPGCSYVLHSSGQLYSHKRKHERRDSELAYRQYRLAQSVYKAMNPMSDSSSLNDSIPFPVDGNGIPNVPGEPYPPMSFSMPFNPTMPLPLSLPADPAFMNLPAGDLPRAMAVGDPSFAFLYGRMPSMFSQFEAVHSGASSSASLEHGGNNDARSPSPVMSEEDAFKLCMAKVDAGKPCNTPCDIYPNEHYHCRSDGCTLAFKSLDAAKEHWRNHEHQEHVSDNYYISVEVDEEPNPCPPSCPFQTQHKHYHCCWEGCSEIILASDKPFRRLDHYKMHEYSRRGQGQGPNQGSKESNSPTTSAFSLDSMFRRKRGRPPKNRVIEVWNESSPTNSGTGPPDMPQAIFTSFKLPKPSTPPLLTPTSGSSSLFLPPYPIHAMSPLNVPSRSKSSSEVKTPSPIPEKQSLSEPKNSKKQSDKYSPQRCISPGVGASVPVPVIPRSESPAKTTVVKAAGTFYPLSAFPTKIEAAPSIETERQSPVKPNPVSNGPVSSSAAASSPAAAAALMTEKPVAYGPEQSCGRPFCKLKRRDHYHCVVCNQAFSEMERLKPHMLKHCSGALSPSMNQWTATSVVERSTDVKEEVEERSDRQDKEELSRNSDDHQFSATPGPSSLHQEGFSAALDPGRPSALHALAFMSPLGTPYGLIPPPTQGSNPTTGHSPFLSSSLQSIYGSPSLLLGNSMTAFGPPSSPAPGPAPKRMSPSPEHLLSPEAKKMRFQSSMRILKDEPVPEGYIRFRFNEDCQYPHCGYREHQTHFHCMRPDCGYSFCDKTRFVQHTARHERLDTLMGGDFQQYRANVACGRQGCLYTASLGTVQNKASHFHCLKCDFVCTDTNKVVAHRRQHQKTDSILAAGFEKFTPSQSCRVESCPHSNKQTHYHCLKCCYAVLGLAQMSAHKYRHLE